MEKKCSHCEVVKHIDNFNKKTRSKDGYDWKCRECAKKVIDSYRKDPIVLARQRRYSKRYNRINRAQVLESQARWISKNKEHIRDYHLKKKYGISIEEYEQLLKAQDSKCAICQIPNTAFKKPLYVDHNHKTKKIRGLLCYKCNIILGHFNDSIDIINGAIRYLNR